MDSWLLATSLPTLSSTPPQGLWDSPWFGRPKSLAHKVHYMDVVSRGPPTSPLAHGHTFSSVLRYHAHPRTRTGHSDSFCLQTLVQDLRAASPCHLAPIRSSSSEKPALGTFYLAALPSW